MFQGAGGGGGVGVGGGLTALRGVTKSGPNTSGEGVGKHFSIGGKSNAPS